MRSILIPLLMVLATALHAQDYRIDRPQWSVSGEIIPEKTFAVEFGHRVTINNSGSFRFEYADLNVRIGMMKLMEMDIALEVPGTLVRTGGGRIHTAGFASPKAGLKVLMKQKEEDSRMGMAFYGSASLNFGSKQFRDAKILPSFRIAMDIDWTETTNMRVNYGIIWQENQAVIDPEGHPVIDPYITVSAAVRHFFNPKWMVFGEIYALVKHDNFRSSYVARTGVAFRIKEHVALDISGGAGLSPQSPRGHVEIGFGGLWPEKNRGGHE